MLNGHKSMVIIMVLQKISSLRRSRKGLIAFLRSERADKVALWNAWREANHKALVDLREASLEGVRLSGIDLSNTQLEKASLRHSTLREASLIMARLENTDFFEANLEQADLRVAYLQDAGLTSARLKYSNAFADSSSHV